MASRVRSPSEEDSGSGLRPNKRRRIEVLYPSFDILPDELILQIFSYVSLPELALKLWANLGNRRLRDLCQDRLFCRSIVVHNEWDSETARRIILMAGPKMKRLSLKKSHDDDASAFAIQALRDSPRLRHLKLFDPSVLTSSVMESIGRSNSLRKVHLTTRTTTSTTARLSAADFISGAADLRNLTSLLLNVLVDDPSADLVSPIADNCKSLKVVTLPYLSSLNDEVFNHFLEKAQRTLRVLRVYGNFLTDDSFCNLNLCRRLSYLSLNGATRLGREGLLAILKLCITDLTIANAKTITGQIIVEAFTGSRSVGSLICLNLTACSGLDVASLDAIATSCPNLKVLLLFGCSQVGDREVRTVLRQCKGLEELGLNLTGVTVKVFVDSSSGLKMLQVDNGLVAEVSKVMPHCLVSQSHDLYKSVSRARVSRLV